MSEKVVSVRLQARVEGFTADMQKAKKSVDDLTKADVPKAAKAYGELADKAALAGAAIAVGLGAAVKRFADFDKAMSAVAANSGAAGAELESLREAAIRLGADSQFSATEAAQGVNELAKAGVETSAVLRGGLKGALDLAAAGQIGVAEAAETTASAMTQFKLGGEDAVRVADLLTNGANKAQGGVGDLGQALAQTGLVANATGLSIEETTAGLTAFASAGLIGSDSGTSFKTMLQRLSAPSGEAAALMSELGISAYDSSGQFVGLAEVAGQLQTSLSDLTPAQRNSALATIFGADAIRGANVLYQQGAQGIRDWTDAVSEQGAAARQAAQLTDNLSGDIERLGGAFDSVLIESGSGANDALRTLTQGLTGLVEVVGKIPGPVLLAGAGLAAIALAVPKGISAFRSYRANLDAVGLSFEKIAARGPRAAKTIELTTKAARGLSTALAALTVAGAAGVFDQSEMGIEQFTRQLLAADDAAKTFNQAILDLDTGSEGLDDTLRTALDPSWFESAQRKTSSLINTLTLGAADLGEPLGIAEDRLTELDSALSTLVQNGGAREAGRIFDDIAAAAKAQGLNVDDLKAKLPGYAEALAGVDNAQTLTAGSGTALAEATDDARSSAEKAADAWDSLKSAIQALGSPLAQQRAANRDYEAALDAVAASVKENGKTLKAGTAEGRANQQALDDLRQATLDKVLADYQLTGSTESATKAMQKGRDAFIDAAREAGLTKQQAKDLADQLGLVPKDVEILVKQSGAETAAAQISGAAVDRHSTIWVTQRFRTTDLAREWQGVGGRAGGGPIWGAGTKTSDSIPIWASDGEFMQKAAAVDKYGLKFMHAVNSLQFPAELARGYRGGGPIQPQYAPRMQVVSVPGPAGPRGAESNDNRLIVEQLVTTAQTGRELRRDLMRQRRYQSNRSAS